MAAKIPYEGRVAIVTSFNSYHAYAPYTIALARTCGVLSKLGVEWDYLARPADFHIERAINNTLTEIMERGDYTDVMMIDSDESWRPEDIVRLLLHPEEIVGGTYRMKNNADEYVGSLKYEDGVPVGRMLPDGTALLEAERLAGGFLRIKVSALRKWAAAYPDLISIEPDGTKVQFFSRLHAPDSEGRLFVYCQDMAFSKRWRDIGGQLWLDPMVQVGHWWFTEHPGDFDAYLRGRKSVEEAKAVLAAAAPAFEVVREMAKARSAA